MMLASSTLRRTPGESFVVITVPRLSTLKMVTSPPRRSTLSVAVWPEMDPNLKQTADRRWPFAEWKAAVRNRFFKSKALPGNRAASRGQQSGMVRGSQGTKSYEVQDNSCSRFARLFPNPERICPMRSLRRAPRSGAYTDARPRLPRFRTLRELRAGGKQR